MLRIWACSIEINIVGDDDIYAQDGFWTLIVMTLSELLGESKEDSALGVATIQ